MYCVGYEDGSDFWTTYRVSCPEAFPADALIGRQGDPKSVSANAWSTTKAKNKVTNIVAQYGILPAGSINVGAGMSPIDIFVRRASDLNSSPAICLSKDNLVVGCNRNVHLTYSGDFQSIRQMTSQTLTENGFTLVYQGKLSYGPVLGIYIRQK
jgi:hypothetical protein